MRVTSFAVRHQTTMVETMLKVEKDVESDVESSSGDSDYCPSNDDSYR